MRIIDIERIRNLIHANISEISSSFDTNYKRRISDEVIRAYSGRPYHNLGHICHMLDLLTEYHNRNPLTQKDLRSYQWAILFHDFVYVPGNRNNEHDSLRELDRLLPTYSMDRKSIEEFIMATAYNPWVPTARNPAAMVMVDLDLAELASPWNVFEHNLFAVQAEVAPTMQRKEFLSKQYLFLTMLTGQFGDALYESVFPKPDAKRMRDSMKDNLKILQEWVLDDIQPPDKIK